MLLQTHEHQRGSAMMIIAMIMRKTMITIKLVLKIESTRTILSWTRQCRPSLEGNPFTSEPILSEFSFLNQNHIQSKTGQLKIEWGYSLSLCHQHYHHQYHRHHPGIKGKERSIKRKRGKPSRKGRTNIERSPDRTQHNRLMYCAHMAFTSDI